jgi:hypothetical protein
MPKPPVPKPRLIAVGTRSTAAVSRLFRRPYVSSTYFVRLVAVIAWGLPLEPPTVSMLSHISAPAKLSSGVHGPAGGNHLTGMRTISSSSDGSMTFTTVDTARRGMVVADVCAALPCLLRRAASATRPDQPKPEFSC